MIHVEIKDIIEAKVIPWERGTFGVAYKTKDGLEASECVGTKVEAEAIVRRIAMVLNTSSDEFNIMPRDIAAS